MAISNTVRSRAWYGVNAPKTLLRSAVTVLVFLALAWAFSLLGWLSFVAYLWLALAVAQVLFTASFLYTTLRGRFRVWGTILDGLNLHGDERILDLGCGRGVVLIAAARRLTTGTAVGVDLWRGQDPSSGDELAARDNVEAEGLADRIELCTADMTALPQADGEFDLVLSSLAIRENDGATARGEAIDEAVRVLGSGGRVAIVDFQHTAHYAQRLAAAGMADVERRPLGWRYWFGGPWAAPALVTARKP